MAMDTPTKQRLIGAAVLIALAVIFLPMLVKGPAPDSGVSDVPLKMPDAPAASGSTETRDLPLVTPGDTGSNGALGGPMAQVQGTAEPTPATGTATPASTPESMAPAGTAAGDYVVHFGTYATSADADVLVSQLRAAQLPGYREETSLNGKPAWRVRVGPYATRSQAEAARVRTATVRDDVGARVVALNAGASAPTSTASASKPTPPAASPEPLKSVPTKPESAKPQPAKPVASAKPDPSVSKPAPTPSRPVVKTEPLPPASKPATVAAKPAEAAKPAAEPAKPAAAGVGFAVQLGAFSNAAQATKKRDELRAAGFSAFTQTVSTDKGTMTRVVAGPTVSRADADALRGRIKSRTGMDGMVRSNP